MKFNTIAALVFLTLSPAPPLLAAPPSGGEPTPSDQDHREAGSVTFLGVEAGPVPEVLSEQLNLTPGFGLVVGRVASESPADTAGVKEHDILQKLNDQILIEPRQLAALVHSFHKGDEITLTVLRKGQELKLQVKLGEHPAPQMGSLEPGFGMHFQNPVPPPGDLLVPNPLGNAAFSVSGSAAASSTTEGGQGNIAATGKVAFRDEGGEIEVVTENGSRTLTAKKPNGEVIFSGPIDTDEERKALPEEVRKKLILIDHGPLPASGTIEFRRPVPLPGAPSI